MSFGCSLGGLSACCVGAAPAPVNMPPTHRVMGPAGPFNNIMDKNPIVNVPSYGMCLVVPSVPKPCVPAAAPWAPPVPTIMLGGSPAFNNSAKAVCSLGGVVSIMVMTQPSVMFG